MEQQQCPICMLFLLPGMNLQDHLETHPKDMIIKALLSVKTETVAPQQPSHKPTPVTTTSSSSTSSSNEMAAVFLTTPFNSSPAHIYQSSPPQQQQQQQQNNNTATTYTIAKRNNINNSNSGSNSNNNNAVILGSRPYRFTIDSPQQQQQQQLALSSSSPTSSSSTTTFLNSSTSAVAAANNNNNNNNNSNSNNNNNSYGRRTIDGGVNDLFTADNSKTAFRCIQQNTEQKNIMIVNTSSTQFSIQQTVPMKKANAAIELHPIIIDNSTLSSNTVPNAISIIPRYTSEKYSGPPPSYESSVTNTINDKQSRVIDLTQTPTMSTVKMMEKQCIVGNSSNSNNNNNNNHTNKLTTTTLNGNNGADENRHHHLMITSAPQKILEYTQTENGDFMITEKVLSTHHHHNHHNHHHNHNHHHHQTATSLNVSHEEEIVEEINDNNDQFNVKYVEIDENLTFNSQQNDEDHFTVIGESVEHMNYNESQGSSSSSSSSSSYSNVIESCCSSSTATKKSGVKVISNVKLTSAEMLSPTIKDIIKQYNDKQTEKEMQIDQAVVDVNDDDDDDHEIDTDSDDNDEIGESEGVKEMKNETALIQCTETLNLGKEKEENDDNDDDDNDDDDEEENLSSICTTSVIKKTTTTTTNSLSNEVDVEKSEQQQQQQQKQEAEPSASTSTECLRKPINIVFNSNPNNRLKQKEIYKQPKKLVVKLKKPLVETGECSSSIQTGETSGGVKKIKDEAVEREAIKTSHINDVAMDVDEEDDGVKERNTSTPVCKVESSEQFTVTFLDQHDYESIKKITVTPEIHQDSETNQSIMSMDLEPETSIVKREQIDSELPIIVKTEMNSCSASSIIASSSHTSTCSRSPNRLNLDNVNSINESSPINFLYQNDRNNVRFSPPLSPYVYIKTFSSGEDQPKQEQEADASWNNSSSIVTQNSDQNSTCSRYTPSFDDNRSSYTDLDVKRNEVHIRAPSTDSLNIRTDEKMPARGEISEQESNGEIEQPWHHPYFQLQAYPSSYDMNTAQECWNLSKAADSSQNACDSNNIQNVIINFPPLNGQQEDIKAPDLLKTIMQTVTKQEPLSINDEASGSNSNIIVKKNRSFRCPECSKVFMKLRARNRHMEQEHPQFRRIKKIKTMPTATQTSKSESTTSVFAASSSSTLVNWNATIKSPDDQEVKVLSIIKNEPSTSAAVLVKNEMNRMLISTTGSIKMEMDRLLLEPSTSSTSSQQISTLGLKIKRTYMCAKCNEQFRTLKLLDKHFQIHPAECTLCQKTFNSWNTFSLHLKHHLNIRVHACRYCPKRFVQRQRLVEHERIHTGHMPIKCPDCDERFRRYSNMLHHRARVHLNKKAKQEDYVCDCGEIFQTKAKLEWHQETHENKPKACPYCRERFTHRNSLTRHIRLSHTEKYVFVKSKAVNCPICNCTYLPSSIKAHMATHQLSNKEFSCSICSKQFSTKWNLKQHHWTHANRSSKPFQCNICPSAFVRETDYTTHMNAHRSIKPFTCNTCGKRFVRKYNWLRHSREHEREKKFTCEICNKKFHRAYYLTEHKRVHTGERPFSCTICGKTSATKTNHNKHIKIHHARDPLTAEG